MTAPAGAAPAPEPPTEPVEEPPTGRPSPHRVWALRVLRIVAVAVAAVVISFVLKDKLPSPSALASALADARWGWVVTALVLQLASIGMMIRLQHRLLHAFGVDVALPVVGAVIYSSTAISLSVPAGSAVGAGYTYRQYRAQGASGATAATVLVLSGVLSIAALVLLYLTGLGLAASGRFLTLGGNPVVAALLGLLVLTAAALVVYFLGRRPTRRRTRAEPVGGLLGKTVAGKADEDGDVIGGGTVEPAHTGKIKAFVERHHYLKHALEHVLATGRQAVTVPGRDWRMALIFGIANWGLDLACLYVSCLAFDIRINPFQVGLLYLGIQVVRQIPLTPGGLGVVEASLLAGLIAAHAAEGPATAAVLIYRLFSAWMIVPIGFVMLAALRRLSARRSRAAGATARV